MGPKLGCQTITFRNEADPRSFRDVLAAVKAAGYDGVELPSRTVDLEAPERLGEALAGHGLALAGLHIGSANFDPDATPGDPVDIRALARAAEALGCRVVPISGTGKGGPERLAALLNAAAPRFIERGVWLCYHNHGPEIADNCRWLEAFCRHADPALIGLALDIGWVQRAGADPLTVLRRFAGWIRYVHLKDTEGDEWRELGRGVVDLPPVLDALRELSLPWWVVEQDRSQRDAAESVRISAEYVAAYRRRSDKGAKS